MMQRQRRTRLRGRPGIVTVSFGLAAIVAACSGVVGDPEGGVRTGTPGSGTPGSSTGNPGSSTGSGTGTGSGSNTQPGVFQPGEAGLRRLTVAQYTNSIHDLLGADIQVPADLEPDTVLSGFASVGATRVSLSPVATEQFETAALSIAHQALGAADRRATLVPCSPAAPTARDSTCSRAFVTQFGGRAWRRPLTGDELTRYATIADSAAGVLGDFWGGLEYGLAGLLQSPNFIYRVEVGTPDPAQASRLVFDDHELATRLAYFLWNTTPDDELLAAAAAGRLRPGDGLKTEATRLLASSRAPAALLNFFAEQLQLDRLADLPQNPTVFPQATATVGSAMREEVLRYMGDAAFGAAGDYRSAFDSRIAFVNPELARLYGVAAPSGTDFVRVTLPNDSPRVGLIGRAGFLAANAHATSTSPTLRGKFIREVLLCQAIPDPPANVIPVLPEDNPMTGPRTMRERLSAHAVGTCATCHQSMDPIGLGLENFDGIGAYRTIDAGKTIDASGVLDGVPFSGPATLATALREHPQLEGCLVRSLYRYVIGHVEEPGEEPAVVALTQSLSAGGHQFRSLLLDIVDSAAFRTAAVSP